MFYTLFTHHMALTCFDKLIALFVFKPVVISLVDMMINPQDGLMSELS